MEETVGIREDDSTTNKPISSVLFDFLVNKGQLAMTCITFLISPILCACRLDYEYHSQRNIDASWRS